MCFVLGAALFATACAGTYRTGVGYGGEPGIAPSAYEHYIRGRLAAEGGDHDTAIAEMRMAAASAPDQVEPRLVVGEELLAAGRLDAAQHEAAYVVETWPRDAAAWQLLGRVRAAGTDVKGAVKALEQAISLDDADEETFLLVAAAYHQLGDEHHAVEAYRRLTRAQPLSAEGHFRLGRVVIGSDPTLAAKELRRAVELDPGHVDARISLADLFQQQGKPDLAQDALRDAFERSGNDTQVGERLYHVLLEGGDLAGAARLLRRLDGDWREASVRLRLGTFLLQLHEGADALRIARSVLAKEEGYQPARLLEARSLAQLGRRAEAVTACLSVPAGDDSYFEARAFAADLDGKSGAPQDGLKVLAEALGKHPSTPLLVTAAASLNEQLGDFDAARKLVDSALEKHPSDEGLVYARANLEDLAGDPDRGVVIMQKLLGANADSVLALNYIGYSYADRGIELDAAERMLKRAAYLRPDDGFVLDSLGWLLLRRGRVDQARSTLERADRLAPFEPEILLHLGEVYLRGGLEQRARDAFRQALALEPTGKIRSRLEERVRTLEARAP